MLKHLLSIYFLVIALIFPLCAQCETVESIVATAKKAESKGDIKRAVQIYQKLIPIYKKGEEKDNVLCSGLIDGGNCSFFNNQYVEALQFYIYGLELAENNKAKNYVVMALHNIGSIYATFSDFEKAQNYFKQGYDKALELGDKKFIGIMALNLVKVDCKLGNSKNAEYYVGQLSKYPTGDRYQTAYDVLVAKGMVLRVEKKYSQALNCLIKALNISKKHRLVGNCMAEIETELAATYVAMNNFTAGVDYYNSAVEDSRSGKYLDQLNEAYRGLAQAYNEMHNRDSAMHYQSLYIALSDSVFNQQKFNEAENNLRELEDRTTNRHINNLQKTIIWLVIAMLLVCIILSLIFYYNQKLRRTYKLLVRKNQELIKLSDEVKVSKRDDAKEDEHQSSNENQDRERIVTDEQKKELLNKILAVMDDTRVISDPSFNLSSLAKMIGSNTKYVSTVINETYKKNFKSFLNEYRIREASRRLADEDNYGNFTIAAIAQSVGFTSANGFNLAFKKIVGMTPSVYKSYLKE